MSFWLIEDASIRRPRAYVSQFGTTALHLRNPFIVAFWSFAFPGCGHLLQKRLLKGIAFICWETIVNTNAKVNLSIMYTMHGKFEEAIQTINIKWFLLYMAIYVFTIWDSYRGTVELNKQYLLANREDGLIRPLTLNLFDINLLDKRLPLIALLFSFLAPGMGHLYVQDVILGLFIIALIIVILYFSNALPAVHYTFTGDFSHAIEIIDMQWFMYLPSFYLFVIYHAYVSTIEYNKLFEKAQSKYLRVTYQNPNFASNLREFFDKQ